MSPTKKAKPEVAVEPEGDCGDFGHCWHQGGKKEPPDFTKPGREWFAGSGYALKHRWL